MCGYPPETETDHNSVMYVPTITDSFATFLNVQCPLTLR